MQECEPQQISRKEVTGLGRGIRDGYTGKAAVKCHEFSVERNYEEISIAYGGRRIRNDCEGAGDVA